MTAADDMALSRYLLDKTDEAMAESNKRNDASFAKMDAAVRQLMLDRAELAQQRLDIATAALDLLAAMGDAAENYPSTVARLLMAIKRPTGRTT